MSHEISMVNGIGEAYYAEQPAWHGLGVVTAEAKSSEEVIKLAHLDWLVEAQPVYLGDGSKVDGYFGTVRKDTGKVLGIVQSRYKVWQNWEAFDFLDSFCQDGLIKYESAMALRDGQRVVLVARMPSVDKVSEGDSLLRYLLCSTSHDGSKAITLMPTSVRVVCANTLRMALGEKKTYQVQIKHTDKMADRLEEAKMYLSQFDSAFTLFHEKAKVLASRRFNSEQAREYINKLFPAPAETATDRVKNNYLKKLEQLRECFKVEKDLVGAGGANWWTLVNSVTRFIDHCTSSKGSNERQREENYYFSVMEGDGANVKNVALDLALAMSA